jgi:hypothetical protein
MKTPRTPRFARALAAAAILATAGATHALAVDSKDNAALGYWRAFSLMSSNKVEFDRDALKGPEFQIGDEWTARLVRSPAIIDRLIEAAAKPDCDFAIEFDKGPDALMPQLGPMRAATRVLILRSRTDLDKGDVAHAVNCIVATLRSARHVVRDETLISSLVGTMLLSDAAPVIEYAVGADLLGPDHLAQIREALDQFSGADPMRAVASMKREHVMTGDWVRALPDDSRSIEKLREFAGDAAATERLQASLSEGGDIRDGLPLYDVYMTQAIAALERRDENEIHALDQALKAGAFGDLAQVIALSFENIVRSVQRADELLASLRETLDR